MEAEEIILRICASVWLCMLQAQSSRRSLHLLKSLGGLPWNFSWETLWHGSVIYVCVPMFPQYSSFGPLAYVGETDNFARRVNEHSCRLLAPNGAVQQPFFHFVRAGECAPHLMRLAICEWIFFPVVPAPGDGCARRALEADWIRKIGVLNPPRVHRLLRSNGVTSRSSLVFGRNRLVCRLRAKTFPSPQIVCGQKLAHDAWKQGLQRTAAALAGHRFPGCGLCALAAWRLSRSAWVYVVQRVTNNESGWRRARALRVLRRIAGIRRDLPSPIAVISCDIPWVGSQQARNLAVHAVRSLVASWRRAGHWLPILRHARIRFRWATTPSLGSVLCSRDFFADFAMVRPPCVCREFLLADPTWPTVTVDGQVHIAASQARIPWPRHLRKFRELPANLRLPPRRQQIAVAVKQMLRRLRDRCKLADEPCWVESVVADLTAALQGLAAQRSTRFPVSWLEISLAREFLRPFFTQVFDHNLSRIGVFCPALVHVQACAALDLGDHGTGLDFAWEADTRRAEVMATMAKIEGLPPHLQPTRLSLVPARSWSIGTPVFLPKWKGPGVKWRLLVNKHHAPATGLHSAVSRAIDVVLDNMPREAWSDFPSANAFLGMVSDFNALVKSMFMEPRGWIAAMDMVDCFHHLPCSEAPSIWDAFSTFWSARHVAYISVPLRRGGGAGRLGLVCDAGWVCFSFAEIREVLMHFTLTNFVALPGLLGRELRGAPMGDALSGAVLRLFKWSREAAQLPVEKADTVCFRRSCSKLVHLCGCNMLVLDVSFRDDLRMFCVWDGQAIIDRERVAQWAISRLRARYHYGTMSLEECEFRTFIGLRTEFGDEGLFVAPVFPDPFGSCSYHTVDMRILQPWSSWTPRSQRTAVIKGWLCRIFHLSSCSEGRALAFEEAFLSLCSLAGFPKDLLARVTRDWILRWVSAKDARAVQCVRLEVERALWRLR